MATATRYTPGIADFRHVVVGIGTALEACMLTMLALAELGVRDIWAKAMTPRHSRILKRTGAHRIIYPEAAMGERVAHLVIAKMIDFVEFDDGFAVAKARTPAEAHNKTLAEAALAARYGVIIISFKHARPDLAHAQPDTVLDKGALLLVCGPPKLVGKFATII